MQNKQSEQRKWFRFVDLFVILFFVLCLVVMMLVLKKNRNVEGERIVQIEYDGKTVYEFSLLKHDDEIFRLKENDNVGFKIENHEICFVDVNCPDKLCENFGYLKSVGETAICLPNKVMLKIISGGKDSTAEIDAIIH